MESQKDQNPPPEENEKVAAAAVAVTPEAPPAAPEAEQEPTSTTQEEAVEVSKRPLRVQTWGKIEESKIGIRFNQVFNRIPNFIGREKAAELLVETEEFKNAKNIKVNNDRAQDVIKYHVIANGKNLYVQPPKKSTALYSKLDVPADADEATQKKVVRYQNWKKHREEITLENKVKLDLVVVGSVLVSREGYRIGRGNGFVDLDICMLIHTGVITPETTIVTTVHEVQVVDTLPEHLFQKYDAPVDIIITPTEVIRVEKRLPRPKGLFWELLSERRLKIVPALQAIKEDEEKNGKVIVLKAEDTDIETNARPQRQGQRGRRIRYRTRSRRSKSEANETTDNEERPQRKRRFTGGRKRVQTKSEGDQSAGENKETNNKKQPNSVRPRRHNNRDFCIKVSNIPRGVRVKDVKSELRKRECNPWFISWKGVNGRCYLHFAKTKGTEKEAEIDKVLASLSDLSITVPHGEDTKTISLAVELLKIEEQNNRVESVNTTTV